MIVGKKRGYALWKSTVATALKRRRVKAMLGLAGADAARGRLRVLEIGCANGKDVIQFLNDPERYDVVGVDLAPGDIDQDNVTVVLADAEALPFEDDSFDLVISVGVLEHIEPMEKLSRVIREASRVGRAYVHVVPCVSTLIEAHNAGFRWPVRLHRDMVQKRATSPLKLNFFSDHTWTKFEGFAEGDVTRRFYLPPLIRNTYVYKTIEQAGGTSR